jgi:TonB family protein
MPRTTNFILIAAALALQHAASPAHAAAQAARQTPAAATAQTAAVENDDYERGRLLLTRGDAAGAAPLLRRAAEARRKDADPWYHLGLALNRLGKTADARNAFEKAVRARPDSAAAHASLAYTFLLLGKMRDAEREAERALALDAQLAEAHFVTGTVRFQQGNFWRAATEAEEALRLNPDFPAAAFLDGDALLNLYGDETTRLAGKHPLAASAGEDERKAVLEKWDAELEPLKARMRETAVRLEGFAAARSDAAAAERLRELAGSLRLYARARGENHGVYRQAEVGARAVITFKPEPGFTEEARRQNVTGRVRLRAVLGADGRVRNIVPVRRLPGGLTEACVEAARRIKFTPATVAGVPVSQFVILEYNFEVR